MADLTLEQLIAKRDDLQDVYDKLISGRGVAEVTYADGGIKYSLANIGALEKRIADLNRQIERANGCAGGGFSILTG